MNMALRKKNGTENSGSTNFNPGTQYEPKSNKHGVGTNNAPSENWRGN